VGVFGYPIDENPTVVIQEAAFKALNLPYRYLTIMVKPDDLEDAIKGLKAMNMKGINLTMPHKVMVLKLLDVVADDAALMGAVNTVYVKDGLLYGENTDGKGFMQALKDSDVALKGKNAVILGAGGAARAIAVELSMAGVGHIEIVNRSKQRGEELVCLLNEKTPSRVDFTLWDGTFRVPENTGLLINGTSIGLYPNTDQKPDIDYTTLNKDMVVCDVIPNHPNTLFLQEAQKIGARTFDGLTMIVNQGALGFKMWTGLDAPVKVMEAALKKEFGID
jgi:shikimate dehydrogenase